MSQSEIIESLLARVQVLEARLNALCPTPNPSSVAPEGILSFDVRKRIEALEEQTPEDHRYASFKEIVVNDLYIEKGRGPAMFDKIYSRIPKMISLKKLKMVSSNGTPLDFGLSLLPDISKIYNCSVTDMKICAGFDFIPYLENFPALLRLEIADHPLRPSLNNNEEKMQKIHEYCVANDITVLCK